MSEQQWQPISTVPKDGTWVLLYLHRYPEDQTTFVARWAEGWMEGRYVERWAADDNATLDINPPTHWMPCPAAPLAARTRRVVERLDPRTARWVVDVDTLNFRDDITDEELEAWVALRIDFLAKFSTGHLMCDRARWRIADYKDS